MTLSPQRSQICPGQISRWAEQPKPAQMALLRGKAVRIWDALRLLPARFGSGRRKVMSDNG